MAIVWQTLKQQDGNKQEAKQPDGSKGIAGVDVSQMGTACIGVLCSLATVFYSVPQKANKHTHKKKTNLNKKAGKSLLNYNY